MAAYPLFNVAWDTNINQPVVICDDICLPWMMCSNEELAAQIPQEALDFTALYYSICHKIENEIRQVLKKHIFRALKKYPLS